jgi:uncharacterized protein YdhG (YjbR/CyaY superfamily)
MAPYTKAENTDAYIAMFPEEIQEKLQQMRGIICKAAPTATEVISYGMPAYKVNSVLVYFAGYNAHIGFYPAGSGIAAFQNEIAKYKNSKGAVQFPLDKPLPIGLITKMVKFRLSEDAEMAKLKAAKKKAKPKK